jgi:hypothetical protein
LSDDFEATGGAAPLVFLASDEISFTTGAAIPVYGGMSV